jgi:hypothetical protein
MECQQKLVKFNDLFCFKRNTLGTYKVGNEFFRVKICFPEGRNSLNFSSFKFPKFAVGQALKAWS